MRFAERFATDFRSIDGVFLGELRQHFADAEIAELGLMISQYVALGRLLVVFGAHLGAQAPYVPDATLDEAETSEEARS